jgi:hypothetical protein
VPSPCPRLGRFRLRALLLELERCQSHYYRIVRFSSDEIDRLPRQSRVLASAPSVPGETTSTMSAARIGRSTPSRRPPWRRPPARGSAAHLGRKRSKDSEAPARARLGATPPGRRAAAGPRERSGRAPLGGTG